MSPFYLMESETETKRLKTIRNWDRIQQQLVATGILSLQGSPHVVDAGSGIGEVAEVMGDLLKEDFDLPLVTLLDYSAERHAEAKRRLGSEKRVRYQHILCDLESIPLEPGCADYVICRFVFEYLSDPQGVFNELARILKPGGKLVVGDLDYNCLTHYPLDPKLEEDLLRVVEALQANNFFDPYIGRKLYSFFHRARLEDIQVHFSAHHLFYGDLSATDEFNWTAKIDRLIELQRRETVRLDLDLEKFKERFFEFLKSPGRFSYTPLILVEGRRPQ